MPLPDDLLELLRAPSPCFLTTLMGDGSPQITDYPGFGPDVQRVKLVIKADRVGGVAAR